MDLKNKYSNLGSQGKDQLQNDVDKPLIFDNFKTYESFYAEVYRQMFKILFRYGMQICGNRELVKDSIQDLFVEFLKNEKTLTKIKSIRPYLLKCLKRKIKRALGKKTQRKKYRINFKIILQKSQDVFVRKFLHFNCF